MSFIKEFKLLLKARYPILYIPTSEEERVEYVIRSCLQMYSNRGVYAWDFVDGYVGKGRMKAEFKPGGRFGYYEKSIKEIL